MCPTFVRSWPHNYVMRVNVGGLWRRKGWILVMRRLMRCVDQFGGSVMSTFVSKWEPKGKVVSGGFESTYINDKGGWVDPKLKLTPPSLSSSSCRPPAGHRTIRRCQQNCPTWQQTTCTLRLPFALTMATMPQGQLSMAILLRGFQIVRIGLKRSIARQCNNNEEQQWEWFCP